MAAVALKPATAAEAVLPWLDTLDMVLVMTVEPGLRRAEVHGGYAAEDRNDPRLDHGARPSCALECDGGIDANTAPLVKAAGCDVLVAGSAVFGRADRAAAVSSIRNA